MIPFEECNRIKDSFYKKESNQKKVDMIKATCQRVLIPVLFYISRFNSEQHFIETIDKEFKLLNNIQNETKKSEIVK